MYRRYRRSNTNILYIILGLVVTALFSLTCVYAALGVSLKINGNAKITSANWDIRFENITTSPGSVVPSKKPTVREFTQVDFTATLNKPGDFLEFTVDIVNKGEIDAMIESIAKSPDLTATQQKYLIYEIKYNDGNSLGNKQLLKAGMYKTIKVRLAYKTDLIASDLPKSPDTLNLSFVGIFTQADETSITGPEGSGEELPKVVKMTKGDINNPQVGDEFYIKDEGFHVISSTSDAITGLAKYNLYAGGEYSGDPVYIFTPYGSEATGKQHPDMKGWISGQKYLERSNPILEC